MQEAPPILFNPLDPSFRIDPYPVYARLRAEAPVYQFPFGGYVLSHYADCEAMLRSPHTSSDFRNSDAFQQFVVQQGREQSIGFMEDARPFLFLDPPDHTRLRGLVNKAFTPRTVEGLRVREARGSLEVIEDFAYPLPVRVICEMLGVPVEDHETFKGWSRELARSLDPEEFLPPDIVERRQRAIESFAQYFTELIAKRRSDPRDDLLSALIAAEEAGDKLTEAELLATCILILVAGHETTVNLIGNGMLALLHHPDQLALLRDDPSLGRSAIEEFLRYDPPVQFTGRVAMQDIPIADVSIPKGQQAMILLASANRDPEVFPEPDRWTSPAPKTATSRSGMASTTASGRRWRASRPRRRSGRLCAGWTACGCSRRRRPTRRTSSCAGWRSCRWASPRDGKRPPLRRR